MRDIRATADLVVGDLLADEDQAAGLDCLVYGLDCLISGMNCLISGLDCLIYGGDCLIWGAFDLVVGDLLADEDQTAHRPVHR